MANLKRLSARAVLLTGMLYALGCAQEAAFKRFSDSFQEGGPGSPGFILFGIACLVGTVVALWWPCSSNAGRLLDHIPSLRATEASHV